MAIQIGGTTVIDNSRNLTNIASIFSCTGIASQAEAEAGTSSTKLMTPQRVAQAIAALSGGSVINRIQRGTSTVYVSYPGLPTGITNVPITSVNTAKSFVIHGNVGFSGYNPGWGSAAATPVQANLTTSTNIRFRNQSFLPGAISSLVDWQVIEYV